MAQSSDKLVERRFTLRLRRFDQHRTMHHKREIHGHRMIAFIDQRLGQIERG